VDPLELALTLDERLRKTVPVKARFRGALDPGYELGDQSLNPARVTVEGPMGLLADVRELSTEFIELAGRTGEFSAAARILNDEPLVAIRGNGLVEFRGIVREQLRIQSFEEIPIRIDQLDDRFVGSLEIPSGSLRIEGGQTMFDRIQEQDVGLYVDCAAIDSMGDFLLPVLVFFPDTFTLVRQDPQEVTIHILRQNEGAGGS
jgi:hypothetical protein